MENALSSRVIATDHRLEKASEQTSEELAQHRWHWTLDESNPKRVSINAYAKSVGRSHVTIMRYAKGYASWCTAGRTASLDESMERAIVGAEKSAAVDAIAEARGIGFRQVRQTRNDEVRSVRQVAQERAERRRTTVAEELPRAAADLVRAEKARTAHAEGRRQRHDMRFFEVEKNLASAKRALTEAMKVASEVDFTDEERELLSSTIENVRALISLVDLRITGSTSVDWDAELAKLGGQS